MKQTIKLSFFFLKDVTVAFLQVNAEKREDDEGRIKI
jgi:hypothetical protein